MAHISKTATSCRRSSCARLPSPSAPKRASGLLAEERQLLENTGAAHRQPEPFMRDGSRSLGPRCEMTTYCVGDSKSAKNWDTDLSQPILVGDCSRSP